MKKTSSVRPAFFFITKENFLKPPTNGRAFACKRRKTEGRRRPSALYWGVIGLLTNVVGLIVYKIYKRGMAICTSCGAAQNAGHLYCSFCGKPLGMRCKGCGGKVGARDEFCPHCGEKLH